MNKIKDTITCLIEKYDTCDPFELSSALNISVFYEELGGIKGYYNKMLQMKQIHINCNLNEHTKKYTCAHELGHALLHPNTSTLFLRSHTFLSVDKLEMEADSFAVNLLIPDEVINESYDYTTEQFARLLGYDKYLIELRFKSYNKSQK